MAERATKKARRDAAPADATPAVPAGADAPRAADDAPPAAAAPVVSSLRGRVPSVPAPDAEALRAFFARPMRWSLNDGGVLRVQAATAGGDAAVPVDSDDARLRVAFETGAGAGGDLPAWHDHAGRSRALAWGLAHEAQLSRLGEALGSSLRPAEDAGDGDGIWLSFDIEEDPQATDPPVRTRGLLQVPVGWLARFARHADPRYAEDPAPPLGHWRDLADAVALGFSIAPLSQRDWRGLRPGDVIVVGRTGRPPQFHATAGRSRWPLSPAAGGWRVDGAAQPAPADAFPSPQQDPTRMSDNETGAAQGAETTEDPARNLPVRVSFEIGRSELSVGEIADLQPGYVFALPAHLEGANVTILANGHVAGRGEVVAVGDTLGVRLLSWS